MRVLPFIFLAIFLAGCLFQQEPDYEAPEQAELSGQPQQQGIEVEQPEEAKKEESKLKESNMFKDLVVSSGEFVINKSRLNLYGNLIVNGSGKLMVVDSEIVFMQDYNQQYRAYFRDNAVLEMTNVRLKTGGNGAWFNFDYRGNVAVFMKNVRGNDCCTPWHGASGNAMFDISNSIIGLTINNNVTVAVVDSSMFFELVLADVNATFNLPVGDVDSFMLEIENNERDRMRIDVRNSSFYRWGTTLDKHTNVSFVDSKITIGMNAGSDWRLPPPTVKASGLKARRYGDFSLNFDTNKLKLVNSEVTSWYPQAWNGAKIELVDSDLSDLQNNGRGSTIIVRDSKVDIAIARENVVQKYYRSGIRQDVIVHDEARIYLFNTTVEGRLIENGNGKIFIDGKEIDS